MVTSCRVFIGPSQVFDTDHRLLVMNIHFPTTKRALQFQLSRTSQRTPKPTPNVQALRDNPELRQNMSDAFDNLYGDDTPTEVNELNEKITTCVRESIMAVCPMNNPEKKKGPWEDEELHQLEKDVHA